MNPLDLEKQVSGEQAVTEKTKKVWITPEIRDQTINSFTEGKPNCNPTEASPGTGS